MRYLKLRKTYRYSRQKNYEELTQFKETVKSV